MQLLSKEELTRRFSFDFSHPYLLVTYHPVTLGGDPAEEVKALLAALDRFPQLGLIFTKANADAGGETINRLLDEYTAGGQMPLPSPRWGRWDISRRCGTARRWWAIPPPA